MKYFSHRIRPHRLMALPLIFIRAFAVLALCLCGIASAQDTHYKLVSPAFAEGQSADQHSYAPSISADGRFIAFTSQAKNLVAFPTSGGSGLPGQGIANIFIRDVQSGTTKLVSINLAGTGSGNGNSFSPSISADGRFVTFSSTSSDLVDNDTNGKGVDVFIRDTQTDKTTLVSANSAGTSSLDGNSSDAMMTPDARFVAFVNTTPDSPVGNVFLRDLQSGTTSLVSVNRAGTGGGNGSSFSPNVSADGRIVAFKSSASDLAAQNAASGTGIYVRDMKNGVLKQVSAPVLEFPLVLTSVGGFALTSDGRYAVFTYTYDQYDPLGFKSSKSNVARVDMMNDTLALLPESDLCSQGTRLCVESTFTPFVSADGRFVTFAQSNSVQRVIAAPLLEAVYLGDFLNLTVTNVTTQNLLSSKANPSVIVRPVISADGRSVAFSTHNKIVPQDTNSFVDVYRFDHDPDPPGVNGVIHFGQGIFRAEENGGSVTLPVLRGAFGATGTTTVQFTTFSYVAKENSDFTPTSGTLTFGPGEDVKFITVPILDDNVCEGVKSFFVSLSNPTDGYVLGNSYSLARVAIHDSIKPTLTINDVTTNEGGDAVFTVTLSNAPLWSFAVNFSSADDTAKVEGHDYEPPPGLPFSGFLFFVFGQKTNTITVHTNRDFAHEPDETFFVNLSPITNDYIIEKGRGVGTIRNDDTPVVGFSPNGASFSASESDGSAVITVSRTAGDTSVPFSVNYATADGTASQRSDYTAAFGTLDFAPGEMSKTFTLLINDDSFVEDFSEDATLTLSSPTNGAIIGSGTAFLFIHSDDSAPPTANPLDDSHFFVTQHYKDFLNRLPDQPGLDFWTNELNQLIARCNSLPIEGRKRQCVLSARAQISTAFFLSIESQQTGYLVYRLYRESFNRPPTLREFLADTQEIGRGVVVGAAGWEQKLEANKQKFADDWVKRPDFRAAFDSMSNSTYVSTLFLFGGSDSGAEPGLQQALAGGLNAAPPTETRATVLRKVADSRTVFNRQYNPGLVLMQYFTYLRRNPGDAPDNSLDGYNFWLAKLDAFSVAGEDVRDPATALARIRRAQMVEAFIDSTEYRGRLGP
jgi:Tol biopolymer transport system component